MTLISATKTYFMKIRELITLLRQDGWYLARTRGSHRQFNPWLLIV